MKLRILCEDDRGPYFVPVEGSPVDLPNMPAGAFAVHANPFARADNREPIYCVTHVETGGKLAGADTADFAIASAREKAKLVTPEMYEQATVARRAIAEGVTETRDWIKAHLPVERHPSTGPRIVCAGCSVPTDNLFKPFCADCKGAL